MITRRQFGSMMVASAAACALPGLSSAQSPMPVLRLGVSIDTLPTTNVADARAAYRIWGAAVARNLHVVRSELVPDVFVESSRLLQMLRDGQVDGIALTAPEYYKVRDLMDPNMLLVDQDEAEGSEYLLLVRRNGRFKAVPDLRGAHLIWQRTAFSSLIDPWLWVALAEHGQPAPAQFFSHIESTDVLTKVLLPVFFGSIDAAVVTRGAFNTAVELNPQLGQELVPLAVSPKLIPVFFCFRRGCDQKSIREYRDVLVRFKNTTDGQQIFRLYRVRGYVERSAAVLKPTLELLHRHEQLKSSPRKTR